MSHASATLVARSARITEAAPARPLLVVEHLDHTVGSTVLFTLCASPTPVNLPSAAPYRAQAMASVAAEGDADAESWV